MAWSFESSCPKKISTEGWKIYQTPWYRISGFGRLPGCLGNWLCADSHPALLYRGFQLLAHGKQLSDGVQLAHTRFFFLILIFPRIIDSRRKWYTERFEKELPSEVFRAQVLAETEASVTADMHPKPNNLSEATVFQSVPGHEFDISFLRWSCSQPQPHSQPKDGTSTLVSDTL